MRRFVTSFACAAVVVILASGTGSGAQKDKQPVYLDKDFLIQAVEGGHAEMKYSELADKHASSDKVKAFARKMVKEHKDMLEGLNRYVDDLKLAIVAGTDKAVRAEADRLSRLDGAAFDQAYIQRMVEDHEKTLAMFETQAKEGKDDRLRKLANDALPHLRDHLKEAKAVAADVKAK
jgi:putative membrane protein